MKTLIRASLLWFLIACGGSDSEPAGEDTSGDTTGDELPPDVAPREGRPELSVEECEAQGGTVVGDIGDGAVHRADYRCPNGSPPIGSVAQGIEGSVCCVQ